MTRQRVGRIQRLSLFLAAGMLLTLGLLSPSTTRQGINSEVHIHRIPLYVKGLSFFDRHCQYWLLAHELTQVASSDSERVLTLFAWTRQHIQPTPASFPVIDDHVLHIIIRGYGNEWQMADVFTTLSTYAGVPAFWKVAKHVNPYGRLVVSFAKIEGRWTVFDVANGFIFVNASGHPADIQELLAHPKLIQAVAGGLAPHGIAYQQYLESLQPLTIPSVLRAEKQMPLPRLVFEARKVLHLIPEEERVGETNA